MDNVIRGRGGRSIAALVTRDGWEGFRDNSPGVERVQEIGESREEEEWRY